MNVDLHILNLRDLPLPDYLYRIIPISRFIDDCSRSTNSLVSPANWSDPYEAAQLRTQIECPLFVDTNGTHSSGLRDDVPRKVGGTWRTGTSAAANVFCQCWSNLQESDAMWRLYSPGTMGVKLRIRPMSLLTSLAEALTSQKVFLGAVEYMSQDELDTLIGDAKTNHLIQSRPNLFEEVPGESWARCLLRKRKQYQHESEYRLIFSRTHPDSASNSAPFLPYKFVFSDHVDEIELDPRCSNVASVEQALRTAGFTGSVRRSNLYEPPSLVVRPSWPESEDWYIGRERKWIDKEV